MAEAIRLAQHRWRKPWSRRDAQFGFGLHWWFRWRQLGGLGCEGPLGQIDNVADWFELDSDSPYMLNCW